MIGTGVQFIIANGTLVFKEESNYLYLLPQDLLDISNCPRPGIKLQLRKKAAYMNSLVNSKNLQINSFLLLILT